jgi:hypothetical protein
MELDQGEAHPELPSTSTTDVSDPEHTTDDQQTTDATSNPESESDEDDDYDEDEESDEEETPDWNPVAFPFLRQLSKTLSSQRAPPGCSFSAHQKYWYDVFTAQINPLTASGEDSQHLTQPPTRKLEIEVLDYEELEHHGCGLHCPCDLDSERDVTGKILVLEEESGLTKAGILTKLRDAVYGECEERAYVWAQRDFAGGLDFKMFNWMSFGRGPSSEYRQRYQPGRGQHLLPCVFFEVTGVRRGFSAEEKMLDERGFRWESRYSTWP